MDNSTKQIKSGALISYFSIFFNIIAGLIYTPWMINQIGKSDYGLFVLVSSFIKYFVFDFGLGSAIARFITKYRLENDEQKVNNLIGITTKIYLFIDLCIFIILFVLFFFIQDIFVELTSLEIIKFRVIYCIAGLFSIVTFPFTPLNGILISYEKFIPLKFCDLITKILTVSIMIIILSMGFKLYGLVLVNSIVGVGIAIIKYIYIRKNINLKPNFNYKNRKLVKTLLGFSIWVTIIGIAQRLILNITPTILGIFSGTKEIAIFSIGMTIEAYVWTFANALNGLFLPKVSQMTLQENSLEIITKLMIKVGRIQFLIMGLIIAGFISLGKEFIILWVGIDFKNSYYVGLFLILPSLITLTQEIGYTMLFVVNELKYRAFLFIVASIVSVITSVFLAPKYGAIGSSIGVFLGLILCHVIGMNVVYVKVLKLDIFRFFKECHLKMIFPFVISILFGFSMQVFFPVNSLVLFVTKALVFSIVYICLMWFFSFNQNEKEMVNSLFKKYIKR